LGGELVAYEAPDDETVRQPGNTAILPLPMATVYEQPADASFAHRESAGLSYLPLTNLNFPDMYANLREPIERYVRYAFNLRREDAEDVVADAFVKAFRALPDGRYIDNPTTWMYGIAKNTAIDLVRRHRIIRIESLTRFPSKDRRSALNIVSPVDDEAYADNVDRRNLLAYIFSHLRPRYATVLRLYDHEGYSYEEIMVLMNVGYSNAKNLVSRGRERAKQLAVQYWSGQTVMRRRVRLVVD